MILYVKPLTEMVSFCPAHCKTVSIFLHDNLAELHLIDWCVFPSGKPSRT